MFQKLTSGRALPSLNALRAFEAMGRTGSATAAAAELHVTHSAVSRQVKALEAMLGVRLFDGPRHQLRLTLEGERLLRGLTPGFDALADAVRGLREEREVRLAIHASLAVKWLIPRLPDFERLYPGLTVQLTDLPITAVRQRDADLVVRFLDGDALHDPAVDRLAGNRIGLVCAPALVDGLGQATRLAAKSHARGWSDWTTTTGQSPPSGRVRQLAHLHFVLDAALAGLGAAVLPWTLVADSVEDGRLVAPFGFVSDGGALAAVRMNRDAPAATRAVIRWLRARAEETESRAP